MKRIPPAAVLFDMDGLLIDSETVALKSLSGAVQALGWTMPDGVAQRLIGLGRDGGQRVLSEALGADFPLLEMYQHWERDYAARMDEGIPAKDGAHAALNVLKRVGIRAAVATSTATPHARHKLEKAGLLEFFDTVVGRDLVPHGKPAPDLYLEAAKRLGVSARHCWAFEDSLPGLTAALAAGARTHWVPDIAIIAQHELPQGVERIGSLHEIIQWVS
jgi:HAD superfamily hydrolase (TIGR01509 family)